MALIKKDFMLLWRGSAQAAVTVVNLSAVEQELQDMEEGSTSTKSSAGSTAYAPVDSVEEDEGTIGTASLHSVAYVPFFSRARLMETEVQPSYTIADESDEEIDVKMHS